MITFYQTKKLAQGSSDILLETRKLIVFLVGKCDIPFLWCRPKICRFFYN